VATGTFTVKNSLNAIGNSFIRAATPSTVEARVVPAEDLIVTVTNLSAGADGIVTLVVMTVADVTDAGVTVYPPPRLSITVTVIPLVKFVPAIDNAEVRKTRQFRPGRY